MTEAATAQRLPVDWAWINERLKLPIFEAVGVSLGYELGTLAPVGRAWKGRPFVQLPEDYRVRVAATYEAVQMGLLPCNSTNIDGASFDPRASFDEGQFWEVSTVEFRRFCDERGWQVPAEFRPNGYASKTTPSDDPAPVVTDTNNDDTTSPAAEDRAQRRERRWQMCIDKGLKMPTDTYSHYPRGVGQVAVALGITRQALTQDLDAYRERLFGK